MVRIHIHVGRRAIRLLRKWCVGIAVRYLLERVGRVARVLIGKYDNVVKGIRLKGCWGVENKDKLC
jgi:hypothetical protein